MRNDFIKNICLLIFSQIQIFFYFKHSWNFHSFTTFLLTKSKKSYYNTIIKTIIQNIYSKKMLQFLSKQQNYQTTKYNY